MLRPAIMTKKSSPKPARPAPPAMALRRGPVPSRNPNLNQQTRKVLAEHYRAKYGVK
jgi:hypothetical protein